MGEVNERVSLRDYLVSVINQRFDALERRLDAYCKMADAERRDHEARLRTLEKREPIRTGVESVLAIVSAIAVALGWRNQ